MSKSIFDRNPLTEMFSSIEEAMRCADSMELKNMLRNSFKNITTDPILGKPNKSKQSMSITIIAGDDLNNLNNINTLENGGKMKKFKYTGRYADGGKNLKPIPADNKGLQALAKKNAKLVMDMGFNPNSVAAKTKGKKKGAKVPKNQDVNFPYSTMTTIPQAPDNSYVAIGPNTDSPERLINNVYRKRGMDHASQVANQLGYRVSESSGGRLMIGKLQDGLVVPGFTGGMIDPTTGERVPMLEDYVRKGMQYFMGDTTANPPKFQDADPTIVPSVEALDETVITAYPNEGEMGVLNTTIYTPQNFSKKQLRQMNRNNAAQAMMAGDDLSYAELAAMYGPRKASRIIASGAGASNFNQNISGVSSSNANVGDVTSTSEVGNVSSSSASDASGNAMDMQGANIGSGVMDNSQMVNRQNGGRMTPNLGGYPDIPYLFGYQIGGMVPGYQDASDAEKVLLEIGIDIDQILADNMANLPAYLDKLAPQLRSQVTNVLEARGISVPQSNAQLISGFKNLLQSNPDILSELKKLENVSMGDVMDLGTEALGEQGMQKLLDIINDPFFKKLEGQALQLGQAMQGSKEVQDLLGLINKARDVYDEVSSQPSTAPTTGGSAPTVGGGTPAAGDESTAEVATPEDNKDRSNYPGAVFKSAGLNIRDFQKGQYSDRSADSNIELRRLLQEHLAAGGSPETFSVRQTAETADIEDAKARLREDVTTMPVELEEGPMEKVSLSEEQTVPTSRRQNRRANRLEKLEGRLERTQQRAADRQARREDRQQRRADNQAVRSNQMQQIKDLREQIRAARGNAMDGMRYFPPTIGGNIPNGGQMAPAFNFAQEGLMTGMRPNMMAPPSYQKGGIMNVQPMPYDPTSQDSTMLGGGTAPVFQDATDYLKNLRVPGYTGGMINPMTGAIIRTPQDMINQGLNYFVPDSTRVSPPRNQDGRMMRRIAPSNEYYQLERGIAPASSNLRPIPLRNIKKLR
tara:strand:+ start:20452 stop:23376 length:2925 start_codon:yes stop_codon:yes gene_type:complete